MFSQWRVKGLRQPVRPGALAGSDSDGPLGMEGDRTFCRLLGEDDEQGRAKPQTLL